MNSQEEKLAKRFVDLLAEKTLRTGQTVWRWNSMPPSWRGIFMEAVPAFLEELGYRVDEGRIDEHGEDEQIHAISVNRPYALFEDFGHSDCAEHSCERGRD